ncbi:hypothetical protein [Sphingobacterium sp. T2]|uniref:hypothetical protein n=1 Tax=Sphingobacterium sp. T2 TaxID=1590596 RepID=UPI000AD78E19|nr:hypothetical protein [Sphingobacterium sp. T2]
MKDFRPEFIFAIGDDATDEDMFLELPSSSITVKVGSRKSAARYYIDTQEDVLKLIKQFTLVKPQEALISYHK